jgi:hypothetical protein
MLDPVGQPTPVGDVPLLVIDFLRRCSTFTFAFEHFGCRSRALDRNRDRRWDLSTSGRGEV